MTGFDRMRENLSTTFWERRFGLWPDASCSVCSAHIRCSGKADSFCSARAFPSLTLMICGRDSFKSNHLISYVNFLSAQPPDVLMPVRRRLLRRSRSIRSGDSSRIDPEPCP